ncbi:hypothetical protein JG687_00017021 [Phytophthora cactorum]|uniref:Uncharacterized protein n=1 Tax=Phytophthora cactorum TaxID=29920 RepID=A0A8T1TQV2_9STRA|nr:hypothetical protein JG687_00017021 [Phytophthora cactorum]
MIIHSIGVYHRQPAAVTSLYKPLPCTPPTKARREIATGTRSRRQMWLPLLPSGSQKLPVPPIRRR